MNKVRDIVGAEGLIIVTFYDQPNQAIITGDPASLVTLDSQPTSVRELLVKQKAGEGLCVELHPCLERYGAQLQAEFTTCGHMC